MRHVLPTLKVTLGTLAALVGGVLWTASTMGGEYLVAITLLSLGLLLLAHGAFSGVESAVAAGTDRSSVDESSRNVDRAAPEGD